MRIGPHCNRSLQFGEKLETLLVGEGAHVGDDLGHDVVAVYVAHLDLDGTRLEFRSVHQIVDDR